MPGSENSIIMFHYVYLLRSENSGDLYLGYTTNLRKRLMEHNNGLNKSTKHARPWKLVYFEGCLDKEDALRREKYLKTNQGSRLLKRRLKEYFYKNKN